MLRTLSLVLVLSSPALAGTLDTPVVGGTLSPPGAWPDVAAVLAPTAMCTGTLIAPDVVLTAGHCIDTHPVEVVLGTIDIAAPGGGGEVIAVKSATAYPDWQHTYDVGVLVLEHPAAAAPRPIASACSARELADGAQVEVVGFGLTSRAGTGQNTKLHQAMLKVDDAACTDPACAAAVAPGGEFVAGGGGTDSCFGDSGGPVFVPAQHEAALIGVVSRGIAASGAPCGGGGIYVRADKVVAWIEHLTSRKLARSTCDSKADGAGDGEMTAGGCSVGSGAGILVALAAVAWILTLRRRQK